MGWIQTISEFVFGDAFFLKIEHPERLWFLIIPLCFMTLSILVWRKRQRALRKWFSKRLEKQLFKQSSFRRFIILQSIWNFGIAFILLAICGIQFGEEKEEIEQSGIEIMLALDVSKSMMTEDLVPNRLDRSKLIINQLLSKLGSDQVGLVVFAGDAYLQTPLTSDHAAIKLCLNPINPGYLPTPGTSLSAAIQKSIDAFPKDSKTKKVIILYTDGENHEPEALETAKMAEQSGIRIYTIGLGSPKGAPIPIFKGNKKIGYKKDQDGSTVISRLNSEILQEISNQTGGAYYYAGSNFDSENLFSAINGLEKTKTSTKQFTKYKDQFQIFTALGLGILLIHFLILPTRKE